MNNTLTYNTNLDKQYYITLFVVWQEAFINFLKKFDILEGDHSETFDELMHTGYCPILVSDVYEMRDCGIWSQLLKDIYYTNMLYRANAMMGKYAHQHPTLPTPNTYSTAQHLLP